VDPVVGAEADLPCAENRLPGEDQRDRNGDGEDDRARRSGSERRPGAETVIVHRVVNVRETEIARSSILSIVIPVFNEREALPDLLDEIEHVCASLETEWEAIVVDDGSTDGSFGVVERRAAQQPRIRGIRFRRNFGKSAALAAGFANSAGDRIVTIDGDGQDDPTEIPALLERLDDGSDLVSGWKRERRDPAGRRWASRLFNRVAGRLSGLEMHDMNCGLKAYRAECARSLEIYGELHRFIPALAAQQGWRVTEVPVNHRPRQHGRSRFGAERYLRGALDLITVVFLGRYRNRPLHLFGGIGIALTVAGVAISAYLTILWFTGESIGRRPLLFLGILLIVVGVQFLTLGLFGQMLVLVRRDRGPAGPDEPSIERITDYPRQGGRGEDETELDDSLGDTDARGDGDRDARSEISSERKGEHPVPHPEP
jgi:dolichol-phosphate mannosyltransferase